MRKSYYNFNRKYIFNRKYKQIGSVKCRKFISIDFNVLRCVSFLKLQMDKMGNNSGESCLFLRISRFENILQAQHFVLRIDFLFSFVVLLGTFGFIFNAFLCVPHKVTIRFMTVSRHEY